MSDDVVVERDVHAVGHPCHVVRMSDESAICLGVYVYPARGEVMIFGPDMDGIIPGEHVAALAACLTAVADHGLLE